MELNTTYIWIGFWIWAVIFAAFSFHLVAEDNKTRGRKNVTRPFKKKGESNHV